jgi:hypothetical protein
MMVRKVVFALALGAFTLPLVRGACSIYPADHVWNTPIDSLPVHANSAALVTTIGAGRTFHADFGSGLWAGGPIGIPFLTVPGTQAKFPATFDYASESDKGPYAVPLNAPIEGGAASTGDRHAIALDADNCLLYELYDAHPLATAWKAGSGAIYDLKSYALRPRTWTSADAAGLPILPGLVRYDEVAAGEIRHAIRFTAPQTKREFVWPARHYASSLTGTQYPPMGQRFRLKASFNISGYSPSVQVILRAMKKYGLILADNGSAWYVSGAPDARWNNDVLRELHRIYGSDMEAVDGTALMISADSGQARQPGATTPRITLSPASATLASGTQQQFTATVLNLTNTQVAWAASAGTIDQLGRFTAPVATTNLVVTITASSVSNPTLQGTASVMVLKRGRR